jgi:NAD(P)-dependent dehydrogenase (short-subunit alcohol dehydrogenase family)
MHDGTIQRFNGKVALVTGASRGLGRAVAKALAREGAHVIASARTRAGLEELDDEVRSEGGEISLLRLDLKDGAKIDNLGPTLYQRWGRLDILVGNAAILGVLAPLGHIKEQQWQDVMAINTTANWRLIRTLDPILRLAPAGRAVFVTSGAAQRSRGYWGPYAASKAALEAMVKVYADEVASTALRVNLFDPGKMNTKMRHQAYPGEDAATLPEPETIAPQVLDLLSEAETRHGTRVDVSRPDQA